jgi:site-specific DNA-adenine methylase
VTTRKLILKSEIPSFPYPGGKGRLSSKIVEYIPKKGRKFIDLFSGRGNVTFRAIAEELGYNEWVLNDINMAPFFRAIRDYGAEFRATPITKAEYYRLGELAKQGDPHAWLMEPFLCYNGGRYFVNWTKGAGGGRRKPESITNVVRLAHRLLVEKQVRITDMDWLDCLKAENLGPDDFVFVDAPYIGCDVDAYSAESICPTELIEYLQKAPFPWVFTEYEQPLYVTAFGEPAYKKEVQLRSCEVQKTKEKRTECIWTNIGKTLPAVTVTVQPVPENRTQTYYTKLSVPKLLAEIKLCMGSMSFSRNQMNREMRERLLPALLELKKRTYRKKPGFYDSLEKIGLNADTVRQWFHRGYTADEAIKKLEEEKTQSPPTKRDERSPEELLLEHADRMAKAVLERKFTYAQKLATQYVETRNESRI